MAFGSNGFPLGPNGEYPKQRINRFNSVMNPIRRVEDVYRDSNEAKLPVVERDFNSSINKVKRNMKQGRIMREGQDVDLFRPRTAKKSKVKGDNWLRQRGNKFPGLGNIEIDLWKRPKRIAETNVLSHGPMWKINRLEGR